MANLRDTIKVYQDDLSEGIAWIAFWREGRSWRSTDFRLELDDDTEEVMLPEQKEELEEILAKDPKAIILNGYLHGHLGTNENGEKATLANLYHGVRWHYQHGGISTVKYFLETTGVYDPQKETDKTENQIMETEIAKIAEIEEKRNQIDIKLSVRDAKSLEEAIKGLTEIVETTRKKYPDVTIEYGMTERVIQKSAIETNKVFDTEKFLKSDLGKELVSLTNKWDKALAINDHSTSNYCSICWKGFQSILDFFTGIRYHFSRSDSYCGIVNDKGKWLIKIR